MVVLASSSRAEILTRPARSVAGVCIVTIVLRALMLPTMALPIRIVIVPCALVKAPVKFTFSEVPPVTGPMLGYTLSWNSLIANSSDALLSEGSTPLFETATAKTPALCSGAKHETTDDVFQIAV